MKKILSVLLVALLLVSVLGLPANISTTANAAYTGGDSVKDIATIGTLPDEVYSAGLDNLQLMNINEDTLDEIVFNDGYTGGSFINNSDRLCYYYDSVDSDVDDEDIAVFKFRECGTVKGQLVDVYLYIDRVKHLGATAGNNKMPLLTQGYNNSRSVLYTSGTADETYISSSERSKMYHEMTMTCEIRKHVESGDGALVTGEKVYNALSDLDGTNDVIQEGFKVGDGHTNNFVVYESCILNAANDNGAVKWHYNKTTPVNQEGAQSYLEGGVYAETDGSGRFTFTHYVANFGIHLNITHSTLPLSYLDVDPNGGTWEGSDELQRFGDYSGNTKDIAEPTRDGYTFTGWTFTGGGSFDAETGIYTYGDTNGMLKANWEKGEMKFRFFNTEIPEGKTAADVETELLRTIAVEAGSTFKLDAKMLTDADKYPHGIPERDGYIFAGWVDGKADDTSVAVTAAGLEAGTVAKGSDLPTSFKTANDSITVTEDRDFYASWIKIGTVDREISDITIGCRNNSDETSVITEKSVDEFGFIGVNIRYVYNGNGKTGLRFLSRMSHSLKQEVLNLNSNGKVSYGHVVAQKAHVVGDLEDGKANVKKSPNVYTHYEGTNYDIFTTVINNIDVAHYSSDIAARPYIEYMDINGHDRTYYYQETESETVEGKAYYTNIKKLATFIDQVNQNGQTALPELVLKYVGYILNDQPINDDEFWYYFHKY